MCTLMMATGLVDTMAVVALSDVTIQEHQTNNVTRVVALSNVSYQLGYLMATLGGCVITQVWLSKMKVIKMRNKFQMTTFATLSLTLAVVNFVALSLVVLTVGCKKVATERLYML